MTDDRPPPEFPILLDILHQVLHRIFGPDDLPKQIVINTEPFRVAVLTSGGARMTLDSDPAAN